MVVKIHVPIAEEAFFRVEYLFFPVIYCYFRFVFSVSLNGCNQLFCIQIGSIVQKTGENIFIICPGFRINKLFNLINDKKEYHLSCPILYMCVFDIYRNDILCIKFLGYFS